MHCRGLDCMESKLLWAWLVDSGVLVSNIPWNNIEYAPSIHLTVYSVTVAHMMLQCRPFLLKSAKRLVYLHQWVIHETISTQCKKNCLSTPHIMGLPLKLAGFFHVLSSSMSHFDSHTLNPISFTRKN